MITPWQIYWLAGLLLLGCKKAPEPTNHPTESIVWVRASNSTTLLSIDEYGRITLKGIVIAIEPELGEVVKKQFFEFRRGDQ